MSGSTSTPTTPQAPSETPRKSFLDDIFTRNNGELDVVGERRFIEALEEQQKR